MFSSDPRRQCECSAVCQSEQRKRNPVLLIFKTHLDIGFTDYAAKVKQSYFNDFMDRALQTAAAMRERDPLHRYCWTVGSFLIYRYLEQAGRCRRRRMERAILDGDITWHALPFTMHSELADEELYRCSLMISRQLDRRFGRRTIAAKMTDVPGHTRGIVAPLADAGVRFLHIGVNPASPVPDVPPLFRWLDSRGNSVIVMYQTDYGAPIDYPQFDLRALLAIKGDNQGAHTPREVELAYETAGALFPDGEVRAGTLDELALRLLPFEEQLPTVTDEIGDSWIHGVGSDPRKVVDFKTLCKTGRQWRTPGFLLRLLEVAEHTWGMDEKKFFAGENSCHGDSWNQVRSSSKARKFAASWKEQRHLLNEAVRLLPAEGRREAKEALARLRPERNRSFRGNDILEPEYSTNYCDFSFDEQNGSICFLRMRDGRILADGEHRLALFSAETFSAADYENFQRRYLRLRESWALLDFGKPFLPPDLPHVERRAAGTRFERISAEEFCFQLQVSPCAGMPGELRLRYRFEPDRPEIAVTFEWLDKDPARLPHALWLSFAPRRAGMWRLLKTGEWIRTDQVVAAAGRRLHAIDRFAECRSLRIESEDAVLVAPACRSLLDFRDAVPDPELGIHFNLYNNVWGTNFPMWMDGDMKFRFRLELRPESLRG